MIEPNTPYERREDMSPVGFLRLIMQWDGDMIIAVVPDPCEKDRGHTSIEFCAHGGQSPHTLKALRELAEAIDRDNRRVPFRMEIETRVSPAESRILDDIMTAIAWVRLERGPSPNEMEDVEDALVQSYEEIVRLQHITKED